MLRIMMLASALLLAAAVPSFAQTYHEDQGDQQQHGHGQGMQGMQGMPWAMMRGERMERLIGALSTGTFFRLKHGDDEIDVHCPRNRQLSDCVTAATALIHEIPHMGQETTDENNEQTDQNQGDHQQH